MDINEIQARANDLVITAENKGTSELAELVANLCEIVQELQTTKLNDPEFFPTPKEFQRTIVKALTTPKA